jgi:hypothetical protein
MGATSAWELLRVLGLPVYTKRLQIGRAGNSSASSGGVDDRFNFLDGNLS